MGVTKLTPGPLFTTKQVAERLGMQRHQIEYRIDRRIIPDSKLRICGRRLFTEQEVQAIEAIIRGDKDHGGNRVISGNVEVLDGTVLGARE
jgi:hypothetical protein